MKSISCSGAGGLNGTVDCVNGRMQQLVAQMLAAFGGKGTCKVQRAASDRCAVMIALQTKRPANCLQAERACNIQQAGALGPDWC